MNQNDTTGNLVNIITDFLILRKQRVSLNGKHSTWASNEAGVPQVSILGPLFFLIYINDLSDDLTSNPKLFGEDTFLFSIGQNINSITTNLNSHLSKIIDWTLQWKMNFNPDTNKRAKEVVFSR